MGKSTILSDASVTESLIDINQFGRGHDDPQDNVEGFTSLRVIEGDGQFQTLFCLIL